MTTGVVPPGFDPSAVRTLTGVFAGTGDEHDTPVVDVIQGKVPADLCGVYLRNGPNPRLAPVGSYTFPSDGDAMVHGVWFDGGAVRYVNRFVRTAVPAADEQAGRALWGGVGSGVRPAVSHVGAALATAGRGAPFVNVISHAGRILALGDSHPSYLLTPALDTVGPYTYGGVLAAGVSAHPRLDPLTGELIVFRAGLQPPFLVWSVVAPDGTARPEQVIDLDVPHLIHDCVITERYLVVFVCPLVSDPSGPARGGPVFDWRPERGTRIAVIARDGSAVRWFDSDAFWVWHFANAYEEQAADGTTTITVDYPCWTHPGLGLPGGPLLGGMARARIALGHRLVIFEQIDDLGAEFPRIDDRRTGRQHRYVHVAGTTTAVVGEWDQLRRYDTVTGTVTTRHLEAHRIGETIFASNGSGTGEDDGYLLAYIYDPAELTTDLLILHAADAAGEPAATLRMPHRVPFGLHGNWIQIP